MGNTIWLQLTDGQTRSGDESDNTFLLKFEQELEGIAERLNVTALTEFYDYSALVEAFGDDVGTSGVGVDPVWSDAAVGLRTFQELRRELDDHPEALAANVAAPRAHWPAALMADLTRCESALRTAVAGRKQFRLLIVP